MPQNTKMIIGAVVAAALAVAVYYGLISQQTATTIQGQANQTLGTGPATQQPASPGPAGTNPQPPAPAAPVPQDAARQPR